MYCDQTRQHVRCLFICACISTFAAGCGTVSQKLTGGREDFEPYRTHEARRIALSDAKRSGKIAVEVNPPDQVAQTDRKKVSELGVETAGASEIQTVQFEEHQPDAPPLPLLAQDETFAATPAPLPVEAESTTDNAPEPTYPIDLPTAFRLAGANNLQIAFAAEQVEQAIAQADAADVLWVPSLRGGVIYNNHSGQIQATEGEVINVNRSSLSVVGGAGTGNAPLNGGSSGPARMFVDLSPVDVLFEPLAARQVVSAREAENIATFNNTLLQTAAAYLDLLRAQAVVSISEEAVKNAEELARLTRDYSRTGRGLQADAERSQAELENRKRDLLVAKEQVAVTSAELARILRLDPATVLVPAEAVPIPLHLIDENSDVHGLIAQAQASRPELSSASASVQETWYRIRQEKLRPWLPHLYSGVSSGGFGGASGSEIDGFSDRTDFDIAAIWEVQNLGLGNSARKREQESLHRQAHITLDRIRDLVATEVAQAHKRVRFRGKQIETTQAQVASATEALSLNLDGIRGGVVRPIELQQAISALASARRQHVDAILQHNQAQFELLRAIGQPPEL